MAIPFSNLLYCAMDCIGYSEESVISRADTFNKLYDVFSRTFTERSGADLVLAGSKSEGVVPFHAGDYDIMIVFNSCLCVDFGCQEKGIAIIETYNKNRPPGYTHLRPLNSENSGITAFLHMCTEYDISAGVVLLKSTSFQQFIGLCSEVSPFYQGLERQWLTFNGPAISVTMQPNILAGVKSANVYGDQVPAIRYYSSSILQEWKNRKRLFEWPSPDTIEDVSTTEGYVVPVGHKDSEEQNFEWRICFTTAEKQLISNLNGVQLKLYILLKMINKDIIQAEVDCVSSYIIKNVIFWTAECTPVYMVTPSNLTVMLLHTLWFLLHCLHNNCLPNYMIPSRNLLLGKIKSEQKPKLKRFLRELLNEGEKIVLRCDKLRNAMYIMHNNRSLATRFRVWRDEVEELLLLINLKMFSRMKPNMAYQRTYIYDILFEFWKDESYLTDAMRLLNLLSVDIAKVLAEGVQGFEEVGTWMNNLLS